MIRSFIVTISTTLNNYNMKLINKGILLIFLTQIFICSCSKDEKFDISKLESEINADFSADKEVVYLNDLVQFTNSSKGATSYIWTFEGGNPESSTEENPVVRFAHKGKYKVSLKAFNDKDETNEVVKSDYITVYSKESWSQFVYPTIDFKNTSLSGNGALYAQLVPKPEELIRSVCFDVCNWLFMDVEEIDVLDKITYTIEDTDGISAKGGQPPHISIFFSSRYLETKQKEGLSDEELLKEIKGVLFHEITHGYQYSPLGAGSYESGTDFYGFIEGMADYVRYVSGYFTTESRSIGGNWKDGYRTSGFFIDWLHSKDSNFLHKFNQTAKTINPWSWEAATQEILQVSVSSLWQEYQNDLKSGKIDQIDQQLKEQRN